MINSSRFFYCCFNIALIILFATPDLAACINHWEVAMHEARTANEPDETPYAEYNLSNVVYYQKQLAIAQNNYFNDPFKYNYNYSEYGLAFVMCKKYASAKRIFLEIEADQPNTYVIAANLGTVYELLGQTDSALFWLKRAVNLRPESHYGSEWIHIKILQAKLSASNNNDQLRAMDILGLDFGNEQQPIPPEGYHVKSLFKQLRYQLGERMSFVQEPDPIVAQMLFAAGNCAALELDPSIALATYRLAQKYGYDGELIGSRIEYVSKLVQEKEQQDERKRWLKENLAYLVSAAVLTLIGVVSVLFKLFAKR